MKGFLKRWGAKGGIGLVCWLLGVGMTDFGYHMKQAVLDTSQDGRLAAVEEGQRRHLEESKPLTVELHKVSRQMDGLLIWLQVVANREGWPPPPQPASFRKPAPVTSPWWIGETRADTICTDGCP